MQKYYLLLLILLFHFAIAQEVTLPKEAIYDRPFISLGGTSTGIGGFLEANTNYFSQDGESDGFSMEMKRFNVFLFSSITERIRFLSEVEFNHGAEDILLQSAFIDLEIHPALVFRGGVILPPIGRFNQNHDGPKWEFVERPLVDTEIIPSTLSEIGFGLNGKLNLGDFRLSYEADLVNGLNDGIILNNQGRTFLAAGKSEESFAEDNNGLPMMTARTALAQEDVFEIGVSLYRGTYNTFKIEGEEIDDKRNLAIYCLDFKIHLLELVLQGELARVNVDVPESISEFYGRKQWGGFVEFNYPFVRANLLSFDSAELLASIRAERIDYNMGTFSETGKNIFDDINAISFGISFRPTSNTVFRTNYRYHWIHDIVGNPTIHRAGFQFGLSSYF